MQCLVFSVRRLDDTFVSGVIDSTAADGAIDPPVAGVDAAAADANPVPDLEMAIGNGYGTGELGACAFLLLH